MNTRWKGAVAVGAALAFVSQGAYAVPSFARQTGLPCSVCHDVPPQLTSFGRTFKLDGYVMRTLPQVADGKNLSINRIVPISAMLQISATTLTHENLKTGYNSQNTNVQFPQQFSFFYAGEITPDIGTFMQITYDNTGGSFAMDNTDIRYAREMHAGSIPVTWGIDINNSPTLEDLWNSTPAFAFPWGHANNAASPNGNADYVVDALAQGVAGIGEYSMWDGHWYEDFSLYRSDYDGQGPQVNPADTNGNAAGPVISGVAPYWRLAWNDNFDGSSLEVGTFGMQAKFRGGYFNRSIAGVNTFGAPGLNDTFTDVAVDTQFDHHFGGNLLTLYATVVHEKRDLAASYATSVSSKENENLNTAKLTGTFQLGPHYQFALNGFAINGTSDPDLYPNTPSGSPDSNGAIARVDFIPWENTQFMIQYTDYTKFDGTTTNAHDANSLYLMAWFLY